MTLLKVHFLEVHAIHAGFKNVFGTMPVAPVWPSYVLIFPHKRLGV